MSHQICECSAHRLRAARAHRAHTVWQEVAGLTQPLAALIAARASDLHEARAVCHYSRTERTAWLTVHAGQRYTVTLRQTLIAYRLTEAHNTIS